MRSRAWVCAGVLAGVAGLAVSYLATHLLTLRDVPFLAVAELVVRLTPGPVVDRGIGLFGTADKPLLLAVMLLGLVALFAVAGAWWRTAWPRSLTLWVVLAAVGAAGALTQSGAGVVDLLPVGLGLGASVGTLALLDRPLRAATAAGSTEPEPTDPERERTGRRTVLVLGVAVGLAAASAGTVGRMLAERARRVQEARRLLRIPGVTGRPAPARARVGLDGVTPWRTANEDFYLIDTTLSVPAIDPKEWRLRIHGLVDRELELTFDDLLARELTEAWVTLACVSNEVGGSLVGNAWWSGVRVAGLLDEAGVHPGADAVLQTSDDGWTCSTPLRALTDGRDALLALAMNGEPLPLEHGFPVRTVVPGLYGYVSACKWVVDLEVTRFADVSAYWTERGWAEQGPVKSASRVDVPRAGETVPAGDLRVGGMAWAQHTGIQAVEVSLDGGAWTRVEIADPGTDDTWVQWAGTVPVAAGDHVLRVRAIDKDGGVQTGVRRDVVPDGATGWHAVEFTAE